MILFRNSLIMFIKTLNFVRWASHWCQACIRVVVAVTVTLLINTLFAVWLARCKVRGFLTVFSAPVLRPGFVFVFDVDQFDEEFGAHLYTLVYMQHELRGACS
jgi:hypothetical protein